MTRRSVILGVLGGLLLCGLVFYSDQVMRNTFLTGNFLPPVVFGALLLLVLGLNPLFQRLRLRPFSAAELAVTAGIWLMACFPAGRSFSHWFGNFLMLPHHWALKNPGWSGGALAFQPEDVVDPTALGRAVEAANALPRGDALGDLARRATDARAAISVGAADDEAMKWATALNRLIEDPSWADAFDLQSLPRPPPPYAQFLAQRAPDRRTAAQQGALARALIETAFPGLEPRAPALLDAVPPGLLADPTRDPRRALDGYVTGLSEPGKPFGWRDVPWAAWSQALGFWLPLLFSFVVWSLGLGLLLHRQWARHELLPYPTAEAIRGLLPEPGRRYGPALRERGFWIAAGLVFAIHTANYFQRWFPDYGLYINLRLDFRPLLEMAPVFRAGGGESLFLPTIYFTAVGFAFYLASDVSLSLGVGPFLYGLAAGTAAGFGVAFSTGGGHLSLDISSAIYGGAVVATFAVIAWSGRHYFAEAFGAAFGARKGSHLPPADRWGARLALLGLAAFVIQLRGAGVEWAIAILYAVFTVMIFTTIARLLAEGGTIFYHPYGSPCVIVWLFMGSRALGYQQLLLISLISTMLIIETRETLLPLALTAFKAADDQGVPLGRVAVWGGALTALGLVVAAMVSIFLQYREGAVRVGDNWTVQGIPQMSLKIADRALHDAQARGELAAAHTTTAWRRWLAVSPRPTYLAAFAIAGGLVLTLTFLRRRFAGWPLHPIFLMLGPTYEGRVFAFSILLGWAVKVLALKYGGARAYQQLKAPMLGLVFGEVLATVVPIVIGTVYSAITGKPPTTMRVLPG